MNRSRRDRRLAVGGVISLLAGLAILVFDTSDERLGGALVLVMGFVLLTVPGSGWLMARRGRPPELGRIERDGLLQPALVIPGYTAKVWLLRLGALGFAALGVLLIVTGAVVVGALAVAFFGGAGVVGGVLARGAYRIVFLPDALQWELGARPSSIAWDDIEGVGVFDINGTPFLGLDARPGTLRTPPAQRWLARVNRAISGTDGQIALEAFRIEPEHLARAVGACAESRERRQEIGTPASLEWLAGSAARR